TALTAGHVELVTRYAPRIALAYDVDAAGQDAATFGARELTALVGEIERSEHRGRLTDVDVVRLPEGRDPDEVIRDTPETWRAATEAPQPIMEFLIDQAAARHDLRTVPGKERFIAAVVPTLRVVADPVRRDAYTQTLARRAGLDERTVLAAVRRPEPAAPGGRRGGHTGARIDLAAVLAQPDAVDPQADTAILAPAERTLLRLVLLHPELIPGLRPRIAPDLLESTPARELWRALVDAAGDTGTLDRTAAYAAMEPTIAGLARSLHARTDPVPAPGHDLDAAIAQSLLALERARLAEAMEFARAELAEAEADHDAAAGERLRHQLVTLQQKRLELDRRHQATSLLADRRRPAQGRAETSPGGPV
ncbi:MAG: hypothetical protein ACKOTZ_06590, partial [Chloroflexota bacterium]